MDNKIDQILQRIRFRSTVMLIVAVDMLWRVSEWGMDFASICNKTGADIAMITAAVQVPATFFAGFVFKLYQEGKRRQ